MRRARRAHRGADRHLALARVGAREQQVGDVGARDQEQERDRAGQGLERGTRGADHDFVERLELERMVLGVGHVAGRHAGAPVGDQRVELGARRDQRRLRSQAAEQIEKVAAAAGAVLGPERERQPHRNVALLEVEARRHHAQQRARGAVDDHRPADDRGRGAERLDPQAVRDDGDRRTTLDVLRFGEDASERRRHAEHREEARAHPRAVHAHRPILAGDAHVRDAVGAHLGERLVPLAVLEELGG